ncbi:GNAT family N-acetyltransferase [Natrialbaceae archaeon A-CW1-1]
MTTLFPDRLETDRLRLEAADPDRIDVDELYAAYARDGLEDESVFEYVPLSPYETPHDALEFLESVAEKRAEGAAATYVIRPREGEDGAGDFAGTTTIFVDWDRHLAELAIVLRKRFWGRGYSGERARALLEVAFDRLDLEAVAVSCLPDNERSRRAIDRYVDRAGGQYEGHLRNVRTLEDEPVDLHRYTIAREEFEASRGEEYAARGADRTTRASKVSTEAEPTVGPIAAETTATTDDHPLFPGTIETDRLRLEALHTDAVDADGLFALYAICSSDPDIEEITEYLTWDPHRTPKETLEYVSEKWDVSTGGSYAIYPRSGEDGDGEFAGDAGFGIDWEARTMTLGVWLRKPFWGRGYSGERATAFMELAFEHLDLEVVTVTVLEGNERSRRAITRYTEARGGGCEGRVRNWRVQDGEPATLYRYTVSREEYQDNQPDVTVRIPESATIDR